MHPSFIRLAATQRPIKVIPQYKYYLRRIPDVGLWFSGIAAFLAGLMFGFGLVIRLKMLLETEECFIKASGGVKKPLYV